MVPSIPCNPDALPHEMRSYPQWVCWKLLPPEKEGDKPRKIPYNPRTGKCADPSDPSTGGTFADAVAAYRRGGYAGVGFIFGPDDPFIGGDIDACRDPQNGQITLEAQAFIILADTYTEVSPSGTGVKFIGKGQKIGPACKRGNFEMYDKGRFFTLTGCHVPGTPMTTEVRQEEFAGLYHAWFPQEEKPEKPPRQPHTTPPCDLLPDDGALLEKIRQSGQGAKFCALFDQGDLSGYGNDASRADAALCCILAYWTQKDAERMDRLFRRSTLMRDKWDERRGTQTYGQRTIQNAIERTTRVYEPGVKSDEAVGAGEDALPTPEPPAEEPASALTKEAWLKRGKRLHAWLNECKETFYWLAADWYNAKVKNLPFGQRDKYVRTIFGDVLARQIHNWATVATHWAEEERQYDLPFWLHTELATQPQEKRTQYMEAFRKSGFRREELRAWLGIKPLQKRRKWWQIVKQDVPDSIGVKLAMALECDPAKTLKRLEVALGLNVYDPDAAPIEYQTDTELVGEAQAHVGGLAQACAEAQNAAKTGLANVHILDAQNGDFEMENASNPASNFHAGVKIDASEQAPPATQKTPYIPPCDHIYKETSPRVEADPFGDDTDDTPPATPSPPIPGPPPPPSVGIVVTLTNEQLERAEKFAQERKRGHDHCRRRVEDKGSDQANLQADRVGMKAEVGLVESLEANDLHPEGWIPLADHAPNGPDFALAGTPFNVKCARPGSRFIYVNEAQRLRQEGKGGYCWPVALLDEHRLLLYKPVPWAEVAKWTLITGRGSSPFRSVELDKLEPLCNLADIRALLHRADDANQDALPSPPTEADGDPRTADVPGDTSGDVHDGGDGEEEAEPCVYCQQGRAIYPRGSCAPTICAGCWADRQESNARERADNAEERQTTLPTDGTEDAYEGADDGPFSWAGLIEEGTEPSRPVPRVPKIKRLEIAWRSGSRNKARTSLTPR